jgi:FSR family fosmidomycin resistance protein-like MFS transporter
VALIGLGSSIFHPEASRVAYLASGGRKGFAQSFFQLGGNVGSAIGPLLAAVFVITQGQGAIAWFGLVPILGMVILFRLGKWYRDHLIQRKNNPGGSFSDYAHSLSKKRIRLSLFILLALLFSKYFYMAGMTNYFTFFLIDKFQLSIQASQYYLFAFLFAIALGTIVGGHLGDRFGRKYVIWFSILGAAPFTLLLPYVGLFGTVFLAILIGFIMASAFSAILVYATDLIPGKIGMISGLFFGFMFGIAGIGSVVLGHLADHSGIDLMFKVCSYLPLIGIIAAFLPDDGLLRKVRS